jgi:hypothetical protein
MKRRIVQHIILKACEEWRLGCVPVHEVDHIHFSDGSSPYLCVGRSYYDF